MNNYRSSFTCSGGFTLIEMAVVLFIFGLLIAGVLGPLETQLKARDRRETIETMEEIIESLYGYAINNGRLPCPDTDGDGLPNPTYDGTLGSAICLGEGFVPWVELNVAQGDAWGNRFRYRVRPLQFTFEDQDGICDGDDDDPSTAGNQAPFEFDLCATGNIQVFPRGDDPSTAGTIEGKFPTIAARNLPAVILSHGRNGFGATSVSGIARPTAPGGTDEARNTDSNDTFYSRGYTGDNAACTDDPDETTPLCAFDDIVMWLSPAILNNRMVTSGRLP